MLRHTLYFQSMYFVIPILFTRSKLTKKKNCDLEPRSKHNLDLFPSIIVLVLSDNLIFKNRSSNRISRVSDLVWYWLDPDPTSQDNPDPCFFLDSIRIQTALFWKFVIYFMTISYFLSGSGNRIQTKAPDPDPKPCLYPDLTTMSCQYLSSI